MNKVDRQRRRNIKITRAMIRLKHSLAADDEIEETLEKALKEFDKAVLKGMLPKPVEPKDVLRD